MKSVAVLNGNKENRELHMKKQLSSLFTCFISYLILFSSGFNGFAATVSEVTTFAALKALNPAAVDNVITVRYRNSVNDGGGGLFFWDSTDTTTADNDGTVLVSTYTPAPSGRWKRIYDGALNVRWFGALPRPDGTTISDDKAGIQQALTVASAVKQELYFPPGIYDVNASGSPLALNVYSNTKITLDPGTEIVMTPVGDIYHHMFLLYGVTNVVISGGTLTGKRDLTSTAHGGLGITIMAGSSDILVKNVGTRNWQNDGFYVENAQRVTLQNCTAVNNRRNGLGLIAGTQIKIVDSWFLSNGIADGSSTGLDPSTGTDIEPNSTESVSDVVIKGCVFTGNTYGLRLSKGYGVSVERVHVQSCSFLSNGLDGFAAYNIADCRVENCISRNNQNWGVSLSTSTNSVLNSLTVIDNMGAVSIDDAAAATLMNSTIRNNTNSGVTVSASVFPRVIGNRIEGQALAVNRSFDGLSVAANGGIISGNVLMNHGESGITVSGSDLLIVGNEVVGNGQSRFLSTTPSGEKTVGGIEINGNRNSITKNIVRKSLCWDSGNVVSATSTTITLAQTASATTDYYVNQTIEILSGTGAGQTNKITAYNGSTKVATVQNSWGTVPTSSSAYLVRDPAHEKYAIWIKSGAFGNVIEDNDIEGGGLYSDLSPTSAGITTYFSGRGIGDPNGVVSAIVGSRFYRTDASSGSVLYIKEQVGTSPNWNTGWTKIGATFSTMTGAVAANTLDNGNYGQTWNWALTSAGATGLTIGESSASTGSDTALLEAKTLSGSTAVPLVAHAGNVGQPVFQTLSDDGTAYTSPGETIFHGRAFTYFTTPTAIGQFSIPDNTLIAIKARIRARSTTGSGALYVIEGAYKRSGSTVTAVGSGPTKTVQQEDVAAWDATMSVSGTTISVNVIGENEVDTTWHATIEVSYLDQ
jgi:hypothetical protein